MIQLALRYYGDPILRKEAEKVEAFDDALREEAEGMVETMVRERGIGLAGPQVGLLKRLIIVLQMEDEEDTEAKPIALVNPEVLERSRQSWVFEEGCLSIPGLTGDVSRAETITVRCQDIEGKTHTIAADGMFARVLLHEIDHLNGKLFIDYLSDTKKSLLKPQLKEIIEKYGR